MTLSIYYAVYVWLFQYYSLHLVYCVDFCTCLVYVRMTLCIYFAVFVWLFQYYSLHLVYCVASLHVRISQDDCQHILCRVCLVISVLLAAFSILC